MTKPKNRFGYIYLDNELDGKRKPSRWVSQKSKFAGTEKQSFGVGAERWMAIGLVLAATAWLYFKFR